MKMMVYSFEQQGVVLFKCVYMNKLTGFRD